MPTHPCSLLSLFDPPLCVVQINSGEEQDKGVVNAFQSVTHCSRHSSFLLSHSFLLTCHNVILILCSGTKCRIEFSVPCPTEAGTGTVDAVWQPCWRFIASSMRCARVQSRHRDGFL